MASLTSGGLPPPTSLPEQKRALRREVAAQLRAMPPTLVEEQSLKVLSLLESLETWRTHAAAGSTVSLFLPIQGGREVDTWPILQTLVDRDVQVAVPLVTGPGSTDMRMVLAPSIAALRSLPLDKWSIPIPDATWPDAGSEVGMIFTPCVAMDRDGHRLGHGKGYYDSYIRRLTELRTSQSLPPPVTVGLALAPQLVDHVPVEDSDYTLDAIVTPAQVCHAPTTAQERMEAAAMRTTVGSTAASEAGALGALAQFPGVDIPEEGVFKWAYPWVNPVTWRML